jgi:hypothetical protein
MRDDNAAFLNWIADRLVHVYGESPDVDFVLRLREIADNAAAECDKSAPQAPGTGR